ncbi:MAG: MOSC domain-containing protein [Deltaproteobacteria bacterium]|nr:MAG: MOSC domain-containing protein [Deltaproteobacteria bacterium]TMQ12681.1 MAG: MOSC domain-containing protein [Deltaproteobacteria bacterium]
MPSVLSVNVGRARSTVHSSVRVTAIDKRPVDGPVEVRAPGSKRDGLGSGLVGDAICDPRHHGGDDQAVYAYARADLDMWAAALGRALDNGGFGENLTTAELDVTGARIGERWRIGRTLVLEVSCPRIPCRTFAGWIGERGWIRRFTHAARPGAYLRVVEPGPVQRGDAIEVVDRPAHDVTIGIVFRALTREPLLLERVLAAGALPAADEPEARRKLERARQAAALSARPAR